MSVHPCTRCGEQAPACTCPDGPHHEPGKGDVTAEIAERVVELTPEVLMQRLAEANREIDELRRTLDVAKFSNKSFASDLAHAREEAARTNRENARLRAELDDARTAYAFLAAERGPTLAEFCESLAARIDAAEQVAARENAAACLSSPSDFPGREREAWEWLETAKRLRWALGQARAFMAGVR